MDKELPKGQTFPALIGNHEQKPKMTKYRIIKKVTYIGDKYLQFKCNDTWRYIPQDDVGYVLGEYLTQKECPTKMPYGYEGRLINCFYGNESFEIGGIIPFTKSYPDIEKYFEKLRKLRKQHLIDDKILQEKYAKQQIETQKKLDDEPDVQYL